MIDIYLFLIFQFLMGNRLENELNERIMSDQT